MPFSFVSLLFSYLLKELLEGMEVEGNGVGALEKLANKLSSFLNDCRNVQVHLLDDAMYILNYSDLYNCYRQDSS